MYVVILKQKEGLVNFKLGEMSERYRTLLTYGMKGCYVYCTDENKLIVQANVLSKGEIVNETRNNK